MCNEPEITIDKLYEVQRDISLREFVKIFKYSDVDAHHLWRQFSTTYSHNLLLFWNYLGKDKQVFEDGIRVLMETGIVNGR